MTMQDQEELRRLLAAETPREAFEDEDEDEDEDLEDEDEDEEDDE